jgi:hypothetical protein
MPCCSTPLTSHVHENVVLRTLDCSPDGDQESQMFLIDPLKFVSSLEWCYDRAVTFSAFEGVLNGFLTERGMVKTVELFNSFFFLDGINTSRILLFERVL